MAKAYINGTEINKFVVDGGGVKIAYGTVFSQSRWTELPEQYKDYIQSCTDLTNMFNSCGNLTSLDLSWLDTSNVTKMTSLFYYCTKLTTLNVSNWNTSNVTGMDYMLNNCSKLTSLDLSNWDTSKVTTMNSMFNGCSAMKYVFGEIDFAAIPSDYYGNLFGYSNNNTLRQITFKNLGLQKGFTKTSGFDKLQNWGVNSTEIPNARQSLIDSLITHSFDRASGGYSTCTITLSANTKAVLTTDEIAQITSKGFTIA